MCRRDECRLVQECRQTNYWLIGIRYFNAMKLLTVITDMALVMESAKIVLLSVKRAKVTEFCMTKTIYNTKVSD